MSDHGLISKRDLQDVGLPFRQGCWLFINKKILCKWDTPGSGCSRFRAMVDADSIPNLDLRLLVRNWRRDDGHRNSIFDFRHQLAPILDTEAQQNSKLAIRSITQPMIGITFRKNSRQDDFMANSIYQKFFSFWRENFESFSLKMNQSAASDLSRSIGEFLGLSMALEAILEKRAGGRAALIRRSQSIERPSQVKRQLSIFPHRS